MKKIILYTLVALITFSGCRKSDNTKVPTLARVPTPSFKLDAASDQFINPGAPANFKGKFILDLFFKNDIPPKKFDVMIMKNGAPASAKLFRADVTTFPVTIDITGQQLIDLFGAPIADGDLFTIGADVTTQSGTLYQAFPTVGVAYGTGVQNEAGGVATSIQFLKPCTFVSSAFAGDYAVVTDEWQDYLVGAVIPVKSVSATQISFDYAVDAGTAKPIVLTINPANNSVTVPKVAYGSYGGTVYSAESVAGAANSVNPCNFTLTVRLLHTTATGYSSAFTISLKKK